MSLMRKVVKIAIGLLIAKLVGKLMRGRGGAAPTGGGDPFGRSLPRDSHRGGDPQLEGMMDDIFERRGQAPGPAPRQPAPHPHGRPVEQDNPFGPDSGPVVAREPEGRGENPFQDGLDNLAGRPSGRRRE